MAYRDEDGDGYAATNAASGTFCGEIAEGYTLQRGDCDDSDDRSYPGAEEVCDGRDNDCLSGVDDGLPLKDFFVDEDADGVGAGAAVKACAAPPGHVSGMGDCDDGDSSRTPGKAELCDEVDNDCDTKVDEELASNPYYRDVDGDGFGVLTDVVQKCRAPAGYVGATTIFDCNDADPAVKPGALELCNDADDNCADGSDEGLDKRWYRDEDNDGFGIEAHVLASCTKPDGYVKATGVFDCNDADSAQRPGATELCNSVDDNCAGGVDEPFTNKGDACTNDMCAGEYVCNSARDGTECNAPPPVSYFADADRDGEGSTNPVDTIKVCASESPPTGYLSTSTDCDDRDPHNKGGGTEVCDDRDNNCANGRSDEVGVCSGRTWKQMTDVVATARNWNTVAVGSSGYPVWIAGESGHLALRTSATSAFTDLFQKCGLVRWNAAWVRPSNGQVFLAGDSGSLATYNGTNPTCTTVNTVNAIGGMTSNKPLLGITGFETSGVVTVYAVNEEGHIYSWTPGNNPFYRARRTPSDPFKSIHGRTPSRLLSGGGGAGLSPVITSYDATTTGSLASHAINGVPLANQGHVLGTWMFDDTHAYAVGQKGLLLRWNGSNSWDFASPDPGMQRDLTSVVAFDDSSVYAVDVAGNILRAGATGWVVHFTASGGTALKDIAATSRQDIWAVGNGTVVHFPE